jgi:hypothetical protein
MSFYTLIASELVAASPLRLMREVRWQRLVQAYAMTKQQADDSGDAAAGDAVLRAAPRHRLGRAAADGEPAL